MTAPGRNAKRNSHQNYNAENRRYKNKMRRFKGGDTPPVEYRKRYTQKKSRNLKAG